MRLTVENKEISKTCCFFGHRVITKTEALIKKLKENIETLVTTHGVYIFLFGSKSQFNSLCYQIVTELKKRYSNIERIYVRAEFPYIDEAYKTFLLSGYEDTYYPDNIKKAGKAVYIERNYEMIKSSRFCICYYDEQYTPPKRKRSKKDLSDYPARSGTSLAYEYAIKKCEVINILS